MDTPLINESSFSTVNPSSYSLAEIWPFPINATGSGLRMGSLGQNSGGGGFAETVGNRDGSVEESTVTEQSGGGGGRKRKDLSSGDESSMVVSTTSGGNDLNESNGKRIKDALPKRENLKSNPEVEASSAGGGIPVEEKDKPEPPKDYIHVRARRGQATDSHSLAERARREKISERMKILQDLVPGCNKVIGKALVLDEIINYVQSLQRQVEFLSMKLEAVNSSVGINPTIEGFHSKDLGAQPFDPSGMILGQRPSSTEYVEGSQHEWLHMHVGGDFPRPR